MISKTCRNVYIQILCVQHPPMNTATHDFLLLHLLQLLYVPLKVVKMDSV